MDILNFISWIKGKRVVTSINPAKTLLPVALQDGRRDDEYLTGAITVQNFANQVASTIPPGAQGPQGPQGVPGPVGPAGLNWQGAWSALGTYVADDAVGFGGASYFCIVASVGPSISDPSVDLVSWALLASQGAIGPQGPQGIQGAQGPAGSGGSGTLPSGTNYQTLYYLGGQWLPSSGLTNNGGRIGINTVNGFGSALRISQTNINQGNAGINLQTTVPGYGVGNAWQTTSGSFQYGINGPSPSPIFNNSIYFTANNSLIKFAIINSPGFPAEKLLLQTNSQVVVGDTFATYTDANLVVKTKGIELEQSGAGIYMHSPSGQRWLVQVSNVGALTVVLA